MTRSGIQRASASKAARIGGVTLVVCVISIMSLVALSSLRSGRVAIDTIGAGPSSANRVDALLLIRDIDTARQEAKLRIYLDPAGALADRSGRFRQNVTIDSSNETTGGLLSAKRGSTTLIADFVTTFDRGDDVSFPFDAYTSTIWFTAALDNGKPVPIRVNFEAADSTFRYNAIDASTTDTEPTFDLIVTRSGLAKTIAVAIIVLMWAMALAVGAVTWLVITRTQWRQRAFEVLGWLAAMLFALIQLRGVAPGAPGFGTLFDFLGFFWAELITATSLCLIVVILIRSELTNAAKTAGPDEPITPPEPTAAQPSPAP